MKLFYFVSILFCFFTSIAFTQEINKDPFNNRIVLKYYTIPELNILKADHLEKFKTIKYTLIHSFVIDQEGMNRCTEFNAQLFDVTEYENLRHADRRIEVFEPKCGIKITLLSKKELAWMIRYDSPYILHDIKLTDK